MGPNFFSWPLESISPFCDENKVLESTNDVILKDQLNYLNGPNLLQNIYRLGTYDWI